MKRSIKKVLGIFLALALVLGVLAPVQAAPEKFTQTLKVHKVLQTGSLTDFGENFYKNDDGTVNLQKPAPAGAKLIAGVRFILVKGDKTSVKPNEIKNIPAGDIVAEGITGADGSVNLDLANQDAGEYTLLEDHAGSTYKGADGEDLTGMLAVPQKFTLPLRDENGVASVVNLFPKNLEDKFGNGGGKEAVTKVEGYEIGEPIPYTITLPVPANSHLGLVSLRDTMDSALTPNDDYVLKYGATELVAGTDYTLKTGAAAGVFTFVIDLTEEGLKKINEQANKTDLVLTYSAHLNDTATPNKVAENTIKYVYGNNPQKPHEDTYTGGDPKTYGAKFKKTNQDKSKGLEGAEFYIKNSAGKYLKQDANLNVSWLDTNTDASVFRSGADGTFEVKGLEKGSYNLEEIKAPSGYAKINGDVAFTVSETTYDAVSLEIPNDPADLPQTGGIGSALFIVGGLGMVLLGVYVMKRRQDA